VVLVTDNAPWHRGRAVADALAANPHLELYRLPSYSPELNGIERVWKWLRRRATHNRLFDTLADLRAAVRRAVRHLQRTPARVRSLLGDCEPGP
jgi:transposase